MIGSSFMVSRISLLGVSLSGWTRGSATVVEDIKQPQTEETISGIISMMSILSAIFLLCGCFVMLFYNLSSKRLKQIESDLLKRKAENIATSKVSD